MNFYIEELKELKHEFAKGTGNFTETYSLMMRYDEMREITPKLIDDLLEYSVAYSVLFDFCMEKDLVGEFLNTPIVHPKKSKILIEEERARNAPVHSDGGKALKALLNKEKV